MDVNKKKQKLASIREKLKSYSQEKKILQREMSILERRLRLRKLIREGKLLDHDPEEILKVLEALAHDGKRLLDFISKLRVDSDENKK